MPVKDGGNEVLSIGILLRADLHRLYDADPPEFTIYPDTGDVSTSNDYLLIHESPLTDTLFVLVSKSDEVTTT